MKIRRVAIILIFLLFPLEVLAEGIRVSPNSALFATLMLGTRYDDNILFVPPEDPLGPQSDMEFLASPALLFKLDQTNIKFDIGYTLNSLLYADMGNPEESHHQYDSLSHLGNLGLTVITNPGFFVGAQGFVEYREATWEEELYQTYYPTTMLHEDSTFKLGFKRGPYANLFTDIGYENIWDQKPEHKLDFFDRIQHRGLFDFKFRFLPRSAVVLNAMIGQLTYPNPLDLNLYPPDERASIPNGYGATYYQGLLGVESNLTTALLIRLLGGYAAMNYESSASYNGFVADTGIVLDYEKRGRVGVGYRRFVEDSIMTNYRIIDMIYFEAWGLFWKRVKPMFAANYQMRNYQGTGNYDEDALSIGPSVEVKFLEWLTSRLDYLYEGMATTTGNSSVDRTRNSVTLSFIFGF